MSNSNKVKKKSTDEYNGVSKNWLHITTGLCVRCGIRILSARNRCPAFDKDKYLEPMFGDVGQARTKAAMLLMTIATTSSRTCTKPTVGCRFFSNHWWLAKNKFCKLVF